MGDDQAVTLAVLDQFISLLWDALLLGVAAAISQVAPHEAAGG